MCLTLRVLTLVLASLGAVGAQTLDPIFFYANMTTENEVPPVTGVQASGTGILAFHILRDASGAIQAGAVDFDVHFTHPEATFVGLHIHPGAAGVNGGVVINTGLSANNTVVHPGGAGRITRQVVVTNVALLEQILAQPDQFYVNLHTTVNPGGVIRGQLQPAELRVFRTRMLPSNEVPPIANLDASGSCSVTALATRDSSGQINGGVTIFDVNYRFPGDITFTGLHLHNGRAGVNAGVVIGTNLSAANPVQGSGSGAINRHVPILTATQMTNFRALFADPSGLYCNLHTTANPGGAIRGQMQNTGLIVMRTLLSTEQEVPPVSPPAAGVGTFAAFVTRDGLGRITSGTVAFEVGHALPGQAEFIGLHIHRAPAGVNGGVVINSGLSAQASVPSATGVGNILRFVNLDEDNPNALAALNGLVNSPDQYYMNLHTTVNPGGVIRGQMALPPGAPAINVNGIISAVGSTTIPAAAPGSIISIFGVNLAQTASDAGGVEAPVLPIALNGTEVRIGNRQAALYYVGPNQINAQVPFEAPEGDVQVFIVRPGDVFSAPYTLRVQRFAPGIFVTPLGAAVVRNDDFSLITAANAAGAGDVLLIFTTGLGGVTPAVASGAFAPFSPVALTSTAPTVTIGGRNAEVIATALSPGFVGLYQVAVRVPAGLASGSHPVVVTIGGVASNSVDIAVR
jgi:uncharacterized protein (TIGR03437 family)